MSDNFHMNTTPKFVLFLEDGKDVSLETYIINTPLRGLSSQEHFGLNSFGPVHPKT